MNLKYNFISKEFLVQEYIDNKKSIPQIAIKLKCSLTPIYSRLVKYNIPTRTSFEYRIGKKFPEHSKRMSGENNPMFDIHRYGKDAPSFGNHHTKKTKEKISNSHKGKKLSKETKEKIRIHSKKLWQDEKYKNKVIKSIMQSSKTNPNKKEKLLNCLLQKILPNEYKYNKTIIIAGLVPDFVNKDNNKIIELYGDYWHNRLEVKKRDKNRLGIYELFGNYKGLIIWEHELKDLKTLKNKIVRFHNER